LLNCCAAEFKPPQNEMARFLARPNRLRRKKAIVIAIHYEGSDQLNLPHRDARKMCRLLKGEVSVKGRGDYYADCPRLLVEKFGFKDEDIIILTDNVAEIEAGTSLPPTRNNIVSGFS